MFNKHSFDRIRLKDSKFADIAKKIGSFILAVIIILAVLAIFSSLFLTN